jgi:hypothetical protein
MYIHRCLYIYTLNPKPETRNPKLALLALVRRVGTSTYKPKTLNPVPARARALSLSLSTHTHTHTHTHTVPLAFLYRLRICSCSTAPMAVASLTFPKSLKSQRNCVMYYIESLSRVLLRICTLASADATASLPKTI